METKNTRFENEFALTAKEEAQVDVIMNELLNDSYLRWANKKINGHFSKCEMWAYNEDSIEIELTFGSQDDVSTNVRTENYTIDRLTMELR
jgi:hypothetical protein